MIFHARPMQSFTVQFFTHLRNFFILARFPPSMRASENNKNHFPTLEALSHSINIENIEMVRLLFALFIALPKPRKGPQRTFQYFKSPIQHNWIEIYFSKARLTRLFECLGSRIDECFGQLLTPIHLWARV